MKAVIRLDVPDWQIGQDVSVYFPDTMCKHGKCEEEDAEITFEKTVLNQQDEKGQTVMKYCPLIRQEIKRCFDCNMCDQDIRCIDGLWCDDITFCPVQCGWKDCPRNQQNIRDKTIPHSFSVEIPHDCPKKLRKGDSDDDQGLR